jgi:hypothetical protein
MQCTCMYPLCDIVDTPNAMFNNICRLYLHIYAVGSARFQLEQKSSVVTQSARLMREFDQL